MSLASAADLATFTELFLCGYGWCPYAQSLSFKPRLLYGVGDRLSEQLSDLAKFKTIIIKAAKSEPHEPTATCFAYAIDFFA